MMETMDFVGVGGAILGGTLPLLLTFIYGMGRSKEQMASLGSAIADLTAAVKAIDADHGRLVNRVVAIETRMDHRVAPFKGTAEA